MNEIVARVEAYLSAPRMSLKERAFLMKRFSFLVRSGMSLPACLEALEGQVSKKGIKDAVATIRGDVEKGTSLSESVSAFPYLFDSFAVQVIRTGETTGALALNLDYLAGELEKRATLRTKLLGAFLYPALIGVFTLCLTATLVLFIFPKIIPIFSGLHVSLPLSTRILLAVNDYLRHWGILTFLVLLIIVMGLTIAFKRSPIVRRRCEAILIRMPLAGSIVRSYTLGNISRTLALLLSSGMTLREAIPGTARATANSLYRTELEALSEVIEEGGDISAFLKTRKALFPDLVAQMVAVGESSGSLVETLRYLSLYYENELDEQTKRLSTLVEPVLMIAMGGIVAFVAVSMVTPLYEITQHLHAK